MAKQKGPVILHGTIGELTFYTMDGIALARRKTSLDKKRVRTDPAFANSRKSSGVFAQAAQIASAIYKELPKPKRKKGLIGTLTGKANSLLHRGKIAEEIYAELKKIAAII